MKKTIRISLSWFLSAILLTGMMTVASLGQITVHAAENKLEQAVKWSIDTANDNSHGYSQEERWGPDYDCSSFVISAMKFAGINVGSASYTGDMVDQFTSNGFQYIAWSSVGGVSGLRRGDVMWRTGHTEMYIGNSQQVGAHWHNGHEATGDPSGTEISVDSYNYNNWECVLRFTGDTTPVTYQSMTVGAKYYVTNKSTGTCLTVDDNSDTQLKNVSVSGQSGLSGQKFEIVSTGTDQIYYLRPELCSSSGRVLNVNGDYSYSGENISIYNFTGHSTQQWRFRSVSGGYAICSANYPNVCLAETGGNVKLASYTGASNQIWMLALVSSDNSDLKNVKDMYPVESTYNFLKSVEGCSTQCFWDVSQWTIGYGNKCPYEHSSNGEYYGQKGGHYISEAEAKALFEEKLTTYVNRLKSNCSGLSMNQNQFDALLSATYNHGNVNNCPLKYYLQGNLSKEEARSQYLEWCINKGTSTEQGLRNRRKKEADLFFSGDTPLPTNDWVYMPVGEIYYLKNNGTGTYMSIDSGEDVQCKNISVYQMTGHAGQQFEIRGSDYDKTYFLRPVLCESSGRVVNINGEYAYNDANIMIYNFTGHSTQQWKFSPVSGGYKICSANNTNYCIAESGTNVQMATYTGASNQIWTLEPVNTEPVGHIMSESEAAGQTIPNGDYYIVNEINSDYFIDIPGDDFDTPNGANIAMWPWGASIPDSRGYDCFHIEYLNNGFYKITQLNTDMCLDVNGASLNRGTNVQMWKYDGNNAQQWSIEKTSHGYQIRSRCNAYYLDVYNGDHEAGTNVRCWEGNDSKAQSFSFIPRSLNERPVSDGVYVIRPKISSQHYLDVAGTPEEFHAGSNVQIWRSADSDAEEKYEVLYVGEGWYKIVEKSSGLVLEVADIGSDFLNLFKNVQLANDNGGKNQLWMIKENSDGTFFIINKATGYYLDLYFAQTDNGTNVSQHTYNGEDAQRWLFDSSCYAMGHDYKLTSQTPATCTTDGKKVYKCSKCGDTKTETIKAPGHTYTTNVVAPTCTEKGYTLHTCTKCGDSYKDSYTDALGHDYKLTSKTAATCETDGQKKYTCSRCDDTKTEVIKATDHNYTEEVVAPTCTEKGYTIHTCSKCGDSYKDTYTVAKGHNYSETIIPPTSSSQGYTLHTCSECGHSYKDNFTEITEPLSNNSIISKTTLTLGETVTVTARASGGAAPYQYSIVFKNASSEYWTVAQDYGTKTVLTLKPEAAGTFEINVRARDANGNIVSKILSVTVEAPAALANTSTLSKTSITLGDSLTVTAKASGGKAPYTYGVYYKKASSEKWTTAQSYNSNATISFKPGAAVKYDVCVKVKDSKGTIAKKYFTVTVTKELVNNSTISAETIKKGSSITAKAKASGGTGKYTYGVYYKKASSEKWSTAQSYGTNTTVTIKPAAAVKYDICVKVKDSSGKIVKKYFTLTVTK